MPPPPDPDTRGRTEGPTPHGGAYAIAHFRDARGDPCERTDAVRVEIVEYDDYDEMIFRTHGDREI